MSERRYLVVTGTCAAEAERFTGLRALDTPMGTLVEAPPFPIDTAMMMAAVERALNPRRCDCGAISHRPECPYESVV